MLCLGPWYKLPCGIAWDESFGLTISDKMTEDPEDGVEDFIRHMKEIVDYFPWFIAKNVI